MRTMFHNIPHPEMLQPMLDRAHNDARVVTERPDRFRKPVWSSSFTDLLSCIPQAGCGFPGRSPGGLGWPSCYKPPARLR